MSASGEAGVPGLRVRPGAERGRVAAGGVRAVEAFSRADAIDPAWMGWGALRVLSQQDWAPGATRREGRVANMERLLLVAGGALDADCGALGRHRVDMGGALWIGAGHGLEVGLANASPDAPLRVVELWLQPDRVNAPPAVGVRDRGGGDVPTGDDASGWELVARGDGQGPGRTRPGDSAGPGTVARPPGPDPGRAGAAAPLLLRQHVQARVGRIAPGGRLPVPADGQRFWLEVLEGEVSMQSAPGGAIDLGSGDGLGWLAGDGAAPSAILAAGPLPAAVLLVALPA